MTLTLTPTLGEFTQQADFMEPAFALLSDSAGLARRVWAVLSRHGLRLSDMRFDQGAGTLGDANLLCYLFNFAVTLRIRLERVEIQCVDLNRVNAQQLTKVGVETLNALETSEPRVTFRTYSFATNFHGHLKNGSVNDFFRKFVSVGSSDLGPNVGNAVVFYFGAQGSRLSSAVTFDLSAQLRDGLFFRVQSVWDAQKIRSSELPVAITDHLREVMARFDLEWGQRGQG